MAKSTAKSKSKSKQRKPVERDDDASEPYSDELNVSSPEVLEMGDHGEVVKNSDWNEKGRREKGRMKKMQAENDEGGEIEDLDNEDV